MSTCPTTLNMHNDPTYFGARPVNDNTVSFIIDGDGTIYVGVGGESTLIKGDAAVALHAFLVGSKL